MALSPEIDSVLARYVAAGARAQIEPIAAAGGMSGALFWRITAPTGKFALRRWPSEHPTAERLRFIHGVVGHAHARGCTFLSVPSLEKNGESFVEHAGHLWELSPWLPGEANYERSPSRPKLSAALSALARFHLTTADFCIPKQWQKPPNANAVTKRLVRLKELQTGAIAPLTRAIDDSPWPQLAELAGDFLAALPIVLPRAISNLEPLTAAPLPLQTCLRDVWHDHVLFTGDVVTGMIDYGAIDVDTPATDIARLLGSLVGDDPAGWQSGLAAYGIIRPLSPDEIQAATALDAAGTLLAGCNWIRWICVERRHFDNQAQVLARFTRLLERLRTIVPRHSLP